MISIWTLRKYEHHVLECFIILQEESQKIKANKKANKSFFFIQTVKGMFNVNFL